MPRWTCSHRALRSDPLDVIAHKRSSWYCDTRCVRPNSTLASSPTPARVIFSGIQPTGVPHLGNFLGALQPWVRLQNEKVRKDELNFSIVDLHALTVAQDPNQLREWRLDTYIALLAVGLDPLVSRVFFQSEVSHIIGNSSVILAHASRSEDIQS